ncbi:MAG: zf-HC2 domain-containing protein, partial [Planctomycetes bacterium]|nr:zf-HC2 domain-containing protein [Planctomycetota bacterium]
MTSHCETTRKGFSERFDDRLSSERRVQLDGHLAHCDPCRRAWAEYQTIFMAVRSMPGLHLDAPPPFPESAPSFVRPVQRKWSRGQVSAVAGLFLALIGVAGGLAFQLDRERKARGLQSPPLESAFLDTPKDVMLASMPDPAAGRVLSRAHNTMAVLGALSEFGSRRSGSEVLDVVTSGVDCLPIDDDADSLLQMNQEDLGRWQGEAQD